MNPFRQILAALCLLALGSASAFAGTSERVVTDRFSGLAISGYDPVAYFTEGAALKGRDIIESERDGAVWRFRNEGNRASFAEHPEIYAPQFGGYDPVDVARGVARAGQPQIWAIIDTRLYLFAEDRNRDSFLAADAASRQTSFDRWPAVEALLAR